MQYNIGSHEICLLSRSQLIYYVNVHDIFIKLLAAVVYREFMSNFVFHLYICFVFSYFVKLYVSCAYSELMSNFMFYYSMLMSTKIAECKRCSYCHHTSTGALCGAGDTHPTTPGLTLGSFRLTMFCSLFCCCFTLVDVIYCCNIVCPYVCSFCYYFWYIYVFYLRLTELAGCWIKISHIVLFYYVLKTKAKSYLHATVTVRTEKTTNVKQT
jgi:hypothetical protein